MGTQRPFCCTSCVTSSRYPAWQAKQSSTPHAATWRAWQNRQAAWHDAHWLAALQPRSPRGHVCFHPWTGCIHVPTPTPRAACSTNPCMHAVHCAAVQRVLLVLIQRAHVVSHIRHLDTVSIAVWRVCCTRTPPVARTAAVMAQRTKRRVGCRCRHACSSPITVPIAECYCVRACIASWTHMTSTSRSGAAHATQSLSLQLHTRELTNISTCTCSSIQPCLHARTCCC